MGHSIRIAAVSRLLLSYLIMYLVVLDTSNVLQKELVPVFKGAYQHVDSDCCGAETSCYECLRNYRNQPYHDELQRGLTRDFLHQIFNAAGLNL